jgi:hypothetical protein
LKNISVDISKPHLESNLLNGRYHNSFEESNGERGGNVANQESALERRVQEIRQAAERASELIERWDPAKIRAVRSSMSMRTLASRYAEVNLNCLSNNLTIEKISTE